MEFPSFFRGDVEFKGAQNGKPGGIEQCRIEKMVHIISLIAFLLIRYNKSNIL